MFLEMKILINFVLFVFATIGCTHIFVDGGITQPLRDAIETHCCKWLHNLITCYQCLGFWAGLLIGGMLVANNLAELLCCGFAGSFLAYWAADYLNYLESKNL
jgi:hypothetical protein